MKIVLVATGSFFFSFAYLLRKRISYIFCPIERYTGKIHRGKTYYFMSVHAIISLILSVFTFLILHDIESIEALFSNFLIRITLFLSLCLFWMFLIGLLIESYLVNTDAEYRSWKEEYLMKDKNR
jgi:hypothetical protein